MFVYKGTETKGIELLHNMIVVARNTVIFAMPDGQK